MKYIVRLLLCLVVYTQFAFSSNDDSLRYKSELDSYLKGLQSVAIDFIQEDSQGSIAEGKLLIVKPHRFLCNYYAPYPIIIVGSSSYVSIYDYDLKQLTRISQDENQLSFLLTDSDDLSNQFNIEKMYVKNGDVVFEIYQEELAKRIYVNFDKKKKVLKSITTEEFNGNIIKIIVARLEKITEVSKDLFIIRNPDMYGEKPRMNKEAIEKKYRLGL
jgi:outer membrane lipoprotein-sorting protein